MGQQRESFPQLALNTREWLLLDGARGRRWIAKLDGREVQHPQDSRRSLPWRWLGQRLPVNPLDVHMQAQQLCRQLGIEWAVQLRRGLRPASEPRQLQLAGRDFYGRRLWLTTAASRAWRQLQRAALADGVELLPISGFRSVLYQAQLLRRKLARGQELQQILAVSAAPGFSEHHTGNALDVAQRGAPALETSFEETEAFDWLRRFAGRHGFVLSYPRGNAFGYSYEPWHWCFQETVAATPGG